MFDREIAEFGRRMGMPGFALTDTGLAVLDVDTLGRLYFEKAENTAESELLIYLVLPVPAHDTVVVRRLLELCSYRNAHPVPLYAGLHNDQILVLTRLSERSVTAAALENTIRFLASIMAKAFA